jgi:hypothetical protein
MPLDARKRLHEPGSCNGTHKSGGIGRSGWIGQILEP